MHLYKRKNSIYYIRYKDSSGCWKLVSTKTKKAGEAKNLFIEFVKNYSPQTLLNKNSTFDSFTKEYLEYSKVNHSPSNTRRINFVITHFKNFIGSILLSEIDNKAIEDYKKLRLNLCKPTTVNIELRALKSMFNTAIKWDLIDKSPFKGVQLLRVAKSYPKYLTKDEAESLCSKTKIDWLRNIIQLAFNTGMRRNELINLQWSHINLEKKYLIISNGESFTTKNKCDRYIPLNNNALKLLKNLPKKSEYVFVTKGNKILYPNYVTQCFRDLKNECKINKNVSFHSLRHTFASWLVQRGVSIYEISKLLGHSDIKVAEIYSHLRAEDLRKSVNLLNN